MPLIWLIGASNLQSPVMTRTFLPLYHWNTSGCILTNTKNLSTCWFTKSSSNCMIYIPNKCAPIAKKVFAVSDFVERKMEPLSGTSWYRRWSSISKIFVKDNQVPYCCTPWSFLLQGGLDLFHNGGLLIYYFICMLIILSDLVNMCKIQKNTYFQTRSERLNAIQKGI